MISIYQGETVNVEIKVVDSAGSDVLLDGAEAVFSFKGIESEEVVSKACTIVNSVIKVKMTSAETSEMIGAYAYEVKLLDNAGDVDMILADRINVSMSIAPREYI